MGGGAGGEETVAAVKPYYEHRGMVWLHHEEVCLRLQISSLKKQAICLGAQPKEPQENQGAQERYFKSAKVCMAHKEEASSHWVNIQRLFWLPSSEGSPRLRALATSACARHVAAHRARSPTRRDCASHRRVPNEQCDRESVFVPKRKAPQRSSPDPGYSITRMLGSGNRRVSLGSL